MPWSFHETATVTDDSFSGVAPAIIVALMDVMRHRTGMALLVVVLAAIIGGAAGMLIGTWRARHTNDSNSSRGEPAQSEAGRERREPTL